MSCVNDKTPPGPPVDDYNPHMLDDDMYLMSLINAATGIEYSYAVDPCHIHGAGCAVLAFILNLQTENNILPTRKQHMNTRGQNPVFGPQQMLV